VEDALTAASALARGVDDWERYVSARLFDDSKRVGEIRSRVVTLLRNADPRWGGAEVDDPGAFLEAYGIRRRPPTLLCAGAGAFHVNGHAYYLEDFEPTATLPRAWLSALGEGLRGDGLRIVTTVENEFPFYEYTRVHPPARRVCRSARSWGTRGVRRRLSSAVCRGVPRDPCRGGG
jgi:hypothetical protein